MISLWQDPLTFYLEVVVLSIRPFHLVSHSPIDEIFLSGGDFESHFCGDWLCVEYY